MLGNRAHEGLQHAAHVRSAAHPHPPQTRGVISASLEGSPPKPSTAPRASASLEDTPRQKGQTALPLTRPPYEGIKCQPVLHSARVRRRQAATPHSGSDRSPVLQLRSLLPGAVATLWEPATHCADVPGTALATVPATVAVDSAVADYWAPRPRSPPRAHLAIITAQ